ARTRVRRGSRAGEFRVGERTMNRAALLDLCGSGVPRLSANAALRTIVQARCLAAVAYVAGPTEALYYRQLEPVHRLIGVPFPAKHGAPLIDALLELRGEPTNDGLVPHSIVAQD